MVTSGADGQVDNAPGITIKGITAIVEETKAKLNSVTEANEADNSVFESSLSGHITSAFQTNKNARRESGIEEEMIESLFQVNMEYRDKELIRIKTGSKIYMGLTATKSRAARSWIKDLIQPANDLPFRIDQSEEEELPEEIMALIEEAFEEDSKRLEQEIEKEFEEARKLAGGGAKPKAPAQGPPQGPPQEGQPAPQEVPPEESAPGALIASHKLKRLAELRRDIEEAVRGEISKIARADLKRLERKCVDSMQDGQWNQALSDFIEDFTIYPTAFLKGPIVTTKKRMVWEGGVAKPLRKVVFLNKRVSAMDVYPSPSAASIYDGNFCEHIRLTKKELSDLSFLSEDTGFKKANIVDVMTNTKPGRSSKWMDSEVEEDIQKAEKRGSQTYASEGIYHGCHFWGTASVQMLIDWGYDEEELEEYELYEEVEIEAIMVGSTVIKCLINRDPLGRRPYYSASFQTRSGSIWGKSLPAMMRDIQKMCNSCARALADNMGLSSGPQVALLVDRLATDGAIEEMHPRMVWQFTSDPQGNGGKPIDFFIVPSNASELLAVYDKFEIKADDVTGVPRYAYGNENVGGAGQTASGLSMLLESASKGIKSSVKNISEGVLIPRVEYEFYMTLLHMMENGNPSNFSGDINVVVHAAEALTIKAAESQLQKELLQATSNPADMEILGMVGRGDILRKVFKGANLPEDAIPSRLILKEREQKKEFEMKKAQAAQAEQQQADRSASVEATTVQIEGQKEMAAKAGELKAAEIQMKDKHKQTDQELKGVEIQQRAESEANKGITKLAETEKKLAAVSADTDRKLSVDLVKNKKGEI